MTTNTITRCDNPVCENTNPDPYSRRMCDEPWVQVDQEPESLDFCSRRGVPMTTKNPTPTEGRSNIMDELAGHVPSAEAVTAAMEALEQEAIESDGRSLGTASVRDIATAALTAAVPVEVARLLGELRALADRYEQMPMAAWAGREIRAVLDTVGVPAPAPELFPGTRDQLGALGVRGVPVQVSCNCPPCPGRGNDGHGMAHCAECCFGTGVEADMDCPEHGVPVVTAIDGRCKARTDFSDPRAINIRCDLSAGHRGPHELVTREVLKSWDDPRAVPAQVDEAATGGEPS